MRSITFESIASAVASACVEANRHLPADVTAALQAAADGETEPIARSILADILENARLAPETRLPLCQDINEGVRRG
jgi:fumarate hydratase subunit alpha